MGLVQPGVYWWNGSLDYVSVVYAVFALEFFCGKHSKINNTTS